MAYGTVNADVIGTSVANSNLGAGNATRFKNRIINGDMRIDQRNAGASVTPTSTSYVTIDRWRAVADVSSKYSLQQVTDAPTGFSFSTKMTSLSAYTVGTTETFGIWQAIEGFNTADLGFGTANAKTITVSFWVKSSLTGTFGGSIQNTDYTRGYPFSYTVFSANTWEQKSITITGDVTGTWVGATNGTGLFLYFTFGAGSGRSNTVNTWTGTQYSFAPTGSTSIVATNGATWQFTGVQLEVGSSATGFEYVDYSTQLEMCQRYFEKSYNYEIKPGTASSIGPIVNFPTQYVVQFFACYKVPKRTDATMTYYSALTGAAGYYTYNYTNDSTVSAVSTGQTSASCYAVTPGNVSAYIHFTASAEL